MLEQGTLPEQIEPEAYALDGGHQVPNNRGGYINSVDDMKKLERYTIMGCEGGSYYATKETIDGENVDALLRLIERDKGEAAVKLIKTISVQGGNVKQNPLIFALAICARCDDLETKKAAYNALNQVCRIPTHLFMFIKFCENESFPNTGWGRSHKTAIQNWYKQFENNPENLARLVTKFKNREGWTHKDVLRLAHPEPFPETIGYIFRAIAKGCKAADNLYIAGNPELNLNSEIARIASIMKVYEKALRCTNAEEMCYIIRHYRLSWEHLPTTMLKYTNVWQALLRDMPIEALIRNLGRMTSCGVFPENSQEEEITVEKISKINNETEPREDEDENEGGTLRRRNVIHPFKILVGLVTYKQGRGGKGKLTWTPNAKIIEALDSSFHHAFHHVEPTNKKFFLAVDVSGSMSQPVLGSSSVTCAMAAAAMMMTVVRTERDCVIRGFSHQLEDLHIDSSDRLEVVMQKTSENNFGPTDCAAPMKYAIEKKIDDIDVFVVYTDNETWYGNVHPTEALRGYREYAQNPAVKLIVCGMCANGFTIADPEDGGMLDMAGFDSAAPQLISDFATH